MKTWLLVSAFCLSLAGIAHALEPILFSPGGDVQAPGEPDRDACWSDVCDLNGYKISSEIIGMFGLESEVANDFQLPGDPGTMVQISNVIVYSGEYGWAPGDEHFRYFNFKFYHDQGCVPGNLLDALGHLEVPNEFFGYDSYGYPTYRYEQPVSVDIEAGVTHWFVMQADDHAFPPQWGRDASVEVIKCEGMFWSPFFGYPTWTPISVLLGFPQDFSQEFECGVPIAVAVTSWGRVRGLYR